MKKLYFTVPVVCPVPYTDKTETYDDCGVLMLPDSYSEDGTPTRLIIFCHGAGGSVAHKYSQTEEQELAKYLVANGYAVVDVNGLPDGYGEKYNVDLLNNVGTPIALQSYVKAYRYCMENYNFYKEVGVHGGSMGGISSTNLVLSGQIPVLAQTAFCPVLDTYNEIFLHPWSNGLPKIALAVINSFEKDENGEYIYDESKLEGHNPMNSSKVHPCPVLFCHCVDDPMVSYEVTVKYIDRAKSQGVNAELLTFPSGGHHPHLYGPVIDEPSGNTMIDGEQLGIKQAVEAAFKWMQTYCR